MCRLFGAVASAPVDISFELLDAENPLVEQSQAHDSGWGIAHYADGRPTVERFPHAAFQDPGFHEAAEAVSRLFLVHVRRATVGGLQLENTHPFCADPYTYCHNGTILEAANLLELASRAPAGDTDSERFFGVLMEVMDPDDVIGSLRRAVELVSARCRFSALNFLFSDGTLLYAYRLGIYRLFWLSREPELEADTQTRYHVHVGRDRADAQMLLVASEQLTDEPWSELGQDELLVCDRDRPDKPRIERLLGEAADEIEFVPLDHLDHLRGADRGQWAARRAETGA